MVVFDWVALLVSMGANRINDIAVIDLDIGFGGIPVPWNDSKEGITKGRKGSI